MGPDIVYPVRKGEYNEELRYSFRSLRNLDHNRVWVAGHKPAWVRTKGVDHAGVHWFPTRQDRGKYRNATESLVELTREIGQSMSRPFLLMNDDFYIMQPVESVPLLTLGPLEEVIAYYRSKRHIGVYWRGMVKALELLKANGITDPLSYEVHAPMPIYREPLLEAWTMGKHLDVLHIRTVYGNLLEGMDSIQVKDPKVYRKVPVTVEGPYLSSNDMVLSEVREAFKEPSPYESD